jgi:hypothetical protein
MKLEPFEFEIVGRFALLTHNCQSMLDKEKGGRASQQPAYTPETDAEAGCYRNEAGWCCIPTVAFRSALIAGLRGKKIMLRSGGRRVAAPGAFKPAVFVDPDKGDLAPLLDPATRKPLTTYVIDTRRAVVQRNAIPRSRPRFNRWALILPLRIDTDVLDPEIVEQEMDDAGRIIGVGDFRIEKGGPFGGFSAKLKKAA